MMKLRSSGGILLVALALLAGSAFARVPDEIRSNTFETALDVDSALDLATSPAVRELGDVATIYIIARDNDPGVVMLTDEVLEFAADLGVEFVVITTTAAQSVTATGDC